MSRVIVKPPKISEKTMRDMKLFFAKTSIPRLLAEQEKKKTEA